MLLQIGQALLAAGLGLEFLAAGRPEEGTATLNEITYAAGTQLIHIVLKHSLIAVIYTPDLDTLMQSRADYSTRCRIHSRAVAATGHDCNTFQHKSFPHSLLLHLIISHCRK